LIAEKFANVGWTRELGSSELRMETLTTKTLTRTKFHVICGQTNPLFFTWTAETLASWIRAQIV